jgi:hypothetical protein
MFVRRSHAISSVEDGFVRAFVPIMLAPEQLKDRAVIENLGDATRWHLQGFVGG